MGCKKVITYSLLAGAVVALHCRVFCNGFDYKINYSFLGVDLANKPDKCVVIRSSAD